MKRFLVALMTAIAVLTMSACGGGSDTGSTSGSKDKVGVDKKVELTQENFASEIMKAQLDAKTAHLTMTMSMGGQEVTMDGDMSLAKKVEDTAMSLTMDGQSLNQGDSTMEMRLIDQIMYMKMGDVTEEKFVKVDLTDEDNPMGEQFNSIMEQSNPASQVKAMGEALVGFENQGDGGKIDGVATTKYLLTLDTVKMYEAQGVDPSTMPGLPETIEYTMFVGEDNLPRRMEVDLAGSKAVNEWTKWGEDVQIVAPSDDQISPADRFFSSQGG